MDKTYYLPPLKRFVIPVITWLAIIIGCFYPYIRAVKKGTTTDRPFYYSESTFLLALFILCCIIYLGVMIGDRHIAKNILQMFVCVVVWFFKTAKAGQTMRLCDESIILESKLTINYHLYTLYCIVLFAYAIYLAINKDG